MHLKLYPINPQLFNFKLNFLNLFNFMDKAFIVSSLAKQNQVLKTKINQYRSQKSTSMNLKGQIEKFVTQSKKNITQMNERVINQNSKQNQRLHEVTKNYETILKQQINLLTQNKKLSEEKDKQDTIFNSHVQKLTKQYQFQIQQFEKKVKVNVKKIQEMSGGNVIRKLLKNQRFKKTMSQRGCSLVGLQKQSQLEDVSEKVQEIQKQIQDAEQKSASLDEELTKMHQLIDTMKQLMQNMMKEKENIVKQNSILKEKLVQSEELIGKLLGAKGAQQGVDQEDYEDDCQQEEEEKVNDQE